MAYKLLKLPLPNLLEAMMGTVIYVLGYNEPNHYTSSIDKTACFAVMMD